MKIFVVVLLATALGASQAFAQIMARNTTTKEVYDVGYYMPGKNSKGLKQMKTGRTLTICGGVLLVGGIILASQADSYYYSASSSSSGSYEEGDPKGAVGVLMIAGGVGMTVPGIILWTKGAKKYKQSSARASLDFGRHGVGLSYRF